ncbi:uncharacterized protein LOC135366957 [Ornithodoros turicata]|uniref:uncharacterized protein LOC135366957 n=1 Tax=Ornithodoros turicata TaxID=34597 RepID=UPI003139756D
MLLIRMTLVVLTIWLCLCLYEAGAYKKGFAKEACKTLCPIVNCTDNGLAAREVELKRSDRGFPLSESFEFDKKIRRTKPFRVTVNIKNGVDVNALMLVFREGIEGKPLGYFKNFSDNLVPVQCDGGPPNAVTNKDFSPKSSFWFEWMPTDISDINIALRGTFVVNDEYWYNIEVKSNFLVDTFPPSMSECGRTKSCVTLSRTAAKCDKASRCDITLKYGLSPDNRTLEVVLGGVAPQTGQYVAVGFTDDRDTMKDIRIFSCRRTEDRAAVEIEDDSLQESEGVIEEVDTEQDGERVWCSFKTPVKVGDYNLIAPRYQVYLHGTADTTTGRIKIGPKFTTSKKKIEIGVPFESNLTSGALSFAHWPFCNIASMLTLQLCYWLLHTE